MKKLFLFAIVVLGFTAASYAQVAATAPTSANIITPISITKDVNLVFGNVAVSTSLGTVVLLPDGSRSVTGGVTLPAITGGPSAASFTINGQPNNTFSITLPSTLTITNSTGLGGETMIVNTFTSTPISTGTLDISGTKTLTVGATLNVGGSQMAGLYQNTTGFSVTVNYN